MRKLVISLVLLALGLFSIYVIGMGIDAASQGTIDAGWILVALGILLGAIISRIWDCL